MLIGIHFFMKSLTNPEKKIELLYDAILNDDEEAFMDNLSVPKNMQYNAAEYLSYLQEQQQIETVLGLLTMQSKAVHKDGQPRFVENDNGFDLFEIQQGKFLGLYPTIEIIPLGTEVYMTADLNEFDVFIDQKKVKLDEGKELLGSILPGKYILEATNDSDQQPDFAEWVIEFDQTEKSKRITIEKSNDLFFLNKESAENLKLDEDALFPIETSYGYEFVNLDGDPVFDKVFDKASHFSEGLAMVEKDGSVHYIDINGEVVFTLGSDVYSEDMKDGMILYQTNDGYNFKNRDGKTMFEQSFYDATEFNEGYAVGFLEDDKTNEWKAYVLKKDGTMILSEAPVAHVSGVNGFNNGLASVYFSRFEPTNLIKKDGTIVKKAAGKYATLEPHETGYILAITIDGSYNEHGEGEWMFEVLNEKFETIIEPTEDGITLISQESLFFNEVDYGYVLRDFDGERLGDDRYKNVEVFNQQYAAVYESDKWGGIDAKGKRIIEPIYDEIEASGNYFIAEKEDKLYILDSNFFVIREVY